MDIQFKNPPMTMHFEADVIANLLAEEKSVVTSTPGGESRLKRLKERHHALARGLAAGLSVVNLSAMTGYTPERIYTLQNDPTFIELLQGYKAQKDTIVIDLTERLTRIAQDALDELTERLEVEPEKVPTSLLMEFVKLGADRTGFGPSFTKNVNHKVGLADRFEAAAERLKNLDLVATEIKNEEG